ncbi:RND efflux system outer membrane lipoprotein [Magnetospirillum fulvum]|uniref:RND efflux system outer membrane lipoprotein n=1 Tax=Magnetospirillum fulvum MGU-K5 TaxID=1316936 RepID=S9S5Z7_MAGFU|nr:RND efflux system outer membrane lipoprotein [Magnetospirillum fulvum]EPY01337.1 RND efflux system outer membrane lipoprotein [Magnetospirillum fulvum MGU-K5]
MTCLRAIVSLALLLLAGCSLAPEPVQPALPVPEAWPSPDRADAGAIRPSRWDRFFIAPALDALIATALDNNRDLRIAVQRADLFPHLNAGADSSRTRTPGDLSYTGKSIIANNFSAS